MQRRCFFS